MLFNLSLRYKLPLLGAVLILVTATALSTSFLIQAWDGVRKDMLKSSGDLGLTMARSLFTTLLHENVWGAFETVSLPFKDGDASTLAESLIVLDAKHQVFASSHPETHPVLSTLASLGSDFAVLDKTSGEAMKLQIERAKEQFDSVGGVLETAVTGLAPGLGEPWFWSVESELAHLLFSVPAVKGVEFGGGFALADARGSAANDAFCYDDAGRVVTKTNHSGGAQGGITNGMPLVIRTAIKPTASIYLPQDTVDLATGQNTTLAIKGRHDPAIVHRARAVVDSVVALGLVDLAAGRFGTDWMAGETAQEKEI